MMINMHFNHKNNLQPHHLASLCYYMLVNLYLVVKTNVGSHRSWSAWGVD
jgi:hypothetical protein